jgi:hypothetical protein
LGGAALLLAVVGAVAVTGTLEAGADGTEADAAAGAELGRPERAGWREEAL